MENLKKEISSDEYWNLPEVIKDKYQQVSLVYDGFNWVDRMFYSHENIEIRTIYRLKNNNKQSTFGGLGMGTF